MKKAGIIGIFLIIAACILFVAKKNFIDPLFVSKEKTNTQKEVVVEEVIPQRVSNESLQVTSMVTAPGGSVYVRVADSEEERRLGLSYFKSLPYNQGMLFKFEIARPHAFWMKDMVIPIDIIWLKSYGNGSYQVVYIVENATPDTYPQRFIPDMPADTVLEINAFQAKSLGIMKYGQVTLVN